MWVNKMLSSCLKFFLWSLYQNTLKYDFWDPPKLKSAQGSPHTPLMGRYNNLFHAYPTSPSLLSYKSTFFGGTLSLVIYNSQSQNL